MKKTNEKAKTYSSELDEIKVKKSKYEKVLSMSNEEIIARAIQDVLKREKEDADFRKISKK